MVNALFRLGPPWVLGGMLLPEAQAGQPLRAINEDLDLSDHMDNAVTSLRIVLAADESVRTGQVMRLWPKPSRLSLSRRLGT